MILPKMVSKSLILKEHIVGPLAASKGEAEIQFDQFIRRIDGLTQIGN
jgi:hypothetical protein